MVYDRQFERDRLLCVGVVVLENVLARHTYTCVLILRENADRSVIFEKSPISLPNTTIIRGRVCMSVSITHPYSQLKTYNTCTDLAQCGSYQDNFVPFACITENALGCKLVSHYALLILYLRKSPQRRLSLLFFHHSRLPCLWCLLRLKILMALSLSSHQSSQFQLTDLRAGPSSSSHSRPQQGAMPG